MQAFQAYATGGTSVVKDSPKDAAIAFFEQNPGKRKCSVIQGKQDGHFFTVAYGLARGGMPSSWKDVTKKTAQDLPDQGSLAATTQCVISS